jgi:hypothetical protein
VIRKSQKIMEYIKSKKDVEGFSTSISLDQLTIQYQKDKNWPTTSFKRKADQVVHSGVSEKYPKSS